MTRWHLVHSQGCITIPSAWFQNIFTTLKGNFVLISSHFLISPSLKCLATTNLHPGPIDLSTLDISFEWNESYNMLPFVSDFLHLAKCLQVSSML